MLKYILADILHEIEVREKRQDPVLKSCIASRLDKSLELYEDNLLKTCEYLLSKNPVTMIKGITKEFKEKEEVIEENNDYDLWFS